MPLQWPGNGLTTGTSARFQPCPFPHLPPKAIGAEPVLVEQCKQMVHQYLPEVRCGGAGDVVAVLRLPQADRKRPTTLHCQILPWCRWEAGLRK